MQAAYLVSHRNPEPVVWARAHIWREFHREQTPFFFLSRLVSVCKTEKYGVVQQHKNPSHKQHSTVSRSINIPHFCQRFSSFCFRPHVEPVTRHRRSTTLFNTFMVCVPQFGTVRRPMISSTGTADDTGKGYLKHVLSFDSFQGV